MYSNTSTNKIGRIIGLALSVFCALQIGISPASAQDKQLHIPEHPPVPRKQPARIDYTPDLLLVMANPKAEQDDINQSLQDAHGTVIGTIGDGRLKCYIVKTEKGHLEDAEKKLSKDKKDFACVGRNYKAQAQWIPNDPKFASEWHLSAINCPKAWDIATGAGTRVAIFDTGCQASNPDLQGKVEKGYDATGVAAHLIPLLGPPSPLSVGAAAIAGAAGSGARTDVHGHGTWVATTAAATANNGTDTAGVAPGAVVYPVQIAGSKGTTDDLSIMAGLLNAMTSGSRIVNISYGFHPPLGFTNAALHAPLHMYFAFFHDVYGGLIFMSAGNDGEHDPDPPMPYLNVVSAIDNSLSLTNFSNWGSPITFTAPGQGIVVSDRSGNVASVDGTSFSSPIVAAEAAMVWNANPALTNRGVEAVLKASCYHASSAAWTPYFGYGMPDAQKAVNMAHSL